MASLLSSSRLGNVSPTSLVKSASSLQTTINDYNDKIQAAQFSTDHSDTSYAAYKAYLTQRISTLQASGTISNLSKAVSLNTALNSATSSNASYNIDQITIQMMAGNATDQAKLDYLTGTVLNNPIIQGDQTLYTKYEKQAYDLQQSIQYQAQVQQNAAITQQNAEATAQAQGYKSSNDMIDSAWKTVQGAYGTGDTKDIKTATSAFISTIKQVSPNTQIPSGAGSSLAIAHLGYMMAKIGNYEQIAAAEPNTPTGVSAAASAEGMRYSTEFYNALSFAAAPQQLFSPQSGPNGVVTQKENAITGYKPQVMKTQFGDITVQVPQSQGNNETVYHQMVTGNATQKAEFNNKLYNTLGLKLDSSTGNYEITQQTPQWFKNQVKVDGQSVGAEFQVIPTAKGFQFITGLSGDSFGVSFDSKGLPGLFKQDTNGNWAHVGGAYGFNDKAGGGLQTAMQLPSEGTKAVVGHIIQNMFGTPGQPRMTQRAGGGFNFTDATGKAISAARYAQLTGQQFRGLLNTMATRGDAGAQQTLGFVGNDMRYDPTKISQGNNASVYNSMTWGVEPNARVSAPNTSGGGLTLPSGFKL